jgi:hypothetical protein
MGLNLYLDFIHLAKLFLLGVRIYLENSPLCLIEFGVTVNLKLYCRPFPPVSNNIITGKPAFTDGTGTLMLFQVLPNIVRNKVTDSVAACPTSTSCLIH